MREVLLAVLLLTAGVLVVVGVAGWSASAALVVAGVLLVGWSLVVVGDVW